MSSSNERNSRRSRIVAAQNHAIKQIVAAASDRANTVYNFYKVYMWWQSPVENVYYSISIQLHLILLRFAVKRPKYGILLVDT